MKKFYIFINEEQIGPLSIEELKQYKISKETKVWFEELEDWKNANEIEVAWKVNIKTIIERGYDLDIKNPTKPLEEKEYNSAELMEMLGASINKSQTLLNQLKQAVK